MKVYVIGSCRVHGPLRSRPQYQKVLSGYTHTAKEAIQRIRYVRGEMQIPDSVAPFIFSRNRAPKTNREYRAALDESDVMLVEVCSGKHIQHQGYWLNLNYALARGLNVEPIEVDMAGDIKMLASMVKRLVVVQHVELAGLDERSRVARAVRNACERAGVAVFAPKVKFDDMLDVNHYQNSVVPRIGDQIMEFIQ